MYAISEAVGVRVGKSLRNFFPIAFSSFSVSVSLDGVSGFGFLALMPEEKC